MTPIRILIGTEPKTRLMEKVLIHSIRRRTKADVQFTPMIDDPHWDYPFPLGRTGFSLRRWLIPEYLNWQGRAIYLDADQLVLVDIRDLWNKPETVSSPPNTVAWMTLQSDDFNPEPWPQSSVMVIDCAKAQQEWGFRRADMLDSLNLNSSRQHYINFMHCTWMRDKIVPIENEWNHLNYCREGATKLVHYTREPFQPPYHPNHALSKLWQRELHSALEASAVTRADMELALSRWGVREDWRKNNGLHPYYKKFLPFCVK